MNLAIVVQRYGADISGGAELHARYIAELLARRHDVEVLTTCAHDYVSWKNELPAGTGDVNGVKVTRFAVDREREDLDFARRSHHVFTATHSMADELAWLDSEGPTSPALIRAIGARAHEFDYFIFFSYRYYHAWHGIRAVAGRSLLVPTAERDAAIGLGIFPPIFRGVRALMYNSFEERALIQEVSANHDVPGVVVGIGSEVPERANPRRFRERFGVRDSFVLYIGRIDANKGCPELFDFFQRHPAGRSRPVSLLLIGKTILPIPKHPRIRHLGFISDEDKFDALAAADALVMPSYYESLSMVAIEAWGLGRPVLANAKCDVLKGQCLRSNAGLFYESFDEFSAALSVLTTQTALQAALGSNGRVYYQRHYAWPVIERKYLDMLDRLASDDRDGRPPLALAPLPGWLARRKKAFRPALSVVASLPSGAVVAPRPPVTVDQRSA